MKAMWAGFAAAIVVAVIAWAALDAVQTTTGEGLAGSSVRIGD